MRVSWVVVRRSIGLKRRGLGRVSGGIDSFSMLFWRLKGGECGEEGNSDGGGESGRGRGGRE